MQLDPPIMGLYIYNTNPVSQAPETNKIVKGLSREDLFFVTAEHFVIDTAAYADIVLPATMAGEHDDMMFSWGHFYLTINEKAIEPRGEAKSNAEIFRLLADGMGYDDPQFKMADMELAESRKTSKTFSASWYGSRSPPCSGLQVAWPTMTRGSLSGPWRSRSNMSRRRSASSCRASAAPRPPIGMSREAISLSDAVCSSSSRLLSRSW
jgi:anaerobic selenocysteine-containing dehydrogenase